MKIEHATVPGYDRIASLFTLHNMAYQGHFWHWDMLLTGLDWKYFNWHQMEFHGHLNLLKTGIVFADALEHGQPAICARDSERAAGLWSGRRVALSPGCAVGHHQRCQLRYVGPGSRSAHRRQLRCEFLGHGKGGLQSGARSRNSVCPSNLITRSIGLIGRLAGQKGWDLVGEVMQRWVGYRDVQWAILGTGDEQYHRLLQRLSANHPNKVAVRLEF